MVASESAEATFINCITVPGAGGHSKIRSWKAYLRAWSYDNSGLPRMVYHPRWDGYTGCGERKGVNGGGD